MTASEAEPTTSLAGAWRGVVLGALIVLTLGGVAASVGLHLLLSARRDVLLGDSTGGAELGILSTALAVIAGTATLVAVGRVRRRSRSRFARIASIIVATAGVITLLGAGCLGLIRFLIVVPAYTHIHLSECDLVVAEKSFLLVSDISIMRRNGLFLEPLAHTGADDGYTPFAADQYVVMRDDGDEIVLRFRFENDSDIWMPVHVTCDGAG
jgi:hypothetical protein